MARYARTDGTFLQMVLIGYEQEKKKIESAIAEIRAQLGTGQPEGVAEIAPKKRTLSAAARNRIAAAQRKRWAAIKKAKAEPVKVKRKLSAAGRKAIADAAKKRWAAQRKATKAQQAAPKPKVGKAAPKKAVTQEAAAATA